MTYAFAELERKIMYEGVEKIRRDTGGGILTVDMKAVIEYMSEKNVNASYKRVRKALLKIVIKKNSRSVNVFESHKTRRVIGSIENWDNFYSNYLFEHKDIFHLLNPR